MKEGARALFYLVQVLGFLPTSSTLVSWVGALEFLSSTVIAHFLISLL